MSQKNNKNGIYELNFVLERFEGSKALLRFGNQQLIIPKRCLARDAEEGDILHGEFITDKAMTKRRENLAKAILEEILKGE